MSGEARFGPYVLETLLGRGGMGEVYRAFDTDQDRLVALKVLAAHLADDPEFQVRFRQEARLAGRLRNPHIIPIHRYGELEDRLFIDMRYVEGYDVGDLIRTVGAVAPARAVSLIEQAASALETAHEAGLIHRDIKPSNLLIDCSEAGGDDFLYLADFGIAKATSSTRSYSLTRTGALLGSLDYMAPEQFDGIADKQTDVYALACVLYELLTGLKPYHGKGVAALMHAHISVPPPIPSTATPTVHPALDEVIRRGMAKTTEERFRSAAELARAARVALGTPDSVTDQHLTDPATAPELRARETDRILELRRTDRLHRDSSRHKIEDVGESPSEPPAGSQQVAASDDTIDSSPTADATPAPGPSTDPEPPTDTDLTQPQPDTSTEHQAAPQPGTSTNGTPSTPAPLDVAGIAAPDSGRAATSGSTESIDTLVHTKALDSRDEREPPSHHGRRQVLLIGAAVVAIVVIIAAVSLTTRPSTTPAASGAPPIASASATPTTSAPPAARASTASLTPIATVPVGTTPQGIALTPDERTAYVANSGSRTVAAVDTASNTVTATFPVPGVPRYLTVSKDARRVFVAMFNDDGSGSGIAVLDLPSRAVVTVIATGQEPYTLTTAPDGRIWVPNHNSTNITVVDPNTFAITATITVSHNPHAVVFSPDGRTAYSADHESNTVDIIDVQHLTASPPIPAGNSPHSLTVSPDGVTIAVGDYGDGTVSFISAATRTVTKNVPAGPTPQSLTYSADGRHLYVVNEGVNQVTSIDTATGQSVSQTKVGASPRFVVASRDGTRLFVTNGDSGTLSVLSCAQ